ncbi:hypothetical protein NCC49_002251 [Naganishia albida]|nr:hypothetical protein NCC49_002251 [Naganishia albida]
MSKSPITCHVLDSSRGKPAQGVAVRLEELVENEGFKPLAQGTTDSDGRCQTLLNPSKKPAAGVYKMIFETGAYFATLNQETFYPKVEIVFDYAKPHEHYHIPLLLSPYSYTTYRGS